MVSTGQRLAQGEAPQILVVEDERIVALSLQGKLEALGYRVSDLVASGSAALAAITAHTPDLILMDINLQGDLNGVQTAALVRERFPVPVVYLTAYSNREVVERAKLTQPFGYILKPFNERELHIVIEMALYRHQMERHLLEHKRLLEATLRSIGDGVVTTDGCGRVTFLNSVAEDLTGWSNADAYGHPVERVVHLLSEVTQQPVETPLVQAMRERTIVPLANHTALIKKGHGPIPIDDSAAPIVDDHKNLLGGVLVFRDMTERRLASRALAQLAAIVASSEDAIVSHSLDGVITSWNPGAERLYGYQSSEIVQQSLALLVPVASLQEVQSALDYLRRGEGVAAYETVHRRKDGRAVDVNLTLSPLRDETGALIGGALIARDITHLRKLEEQYRQAQKMEAIGRLAGGVAHDFNNLLTVINGYTSIVTASLEAHDKNRDMLDQVVRAGERAANLTQQLLAYSRKQMLQTRVIALNDLIKDINSMLQRLIGADVEVQLRCDPALRPVKADPTQMEQVVLNLAVNARDAMPGGGTLTIETANVDLHARPLGTEGDIVSGPYITLTVSDTGSGMDEATLARLFEPFFTTKDQGKGTGLGLATVYGIVRQSGGHIAVESTLGHGSRFTIYLPGLDEAPANQPGSARRTFPSGTETVLIVEDEEGVRKLSAHLLRRCGYSILEAPDGATALTVVTDRSEPIHLLVTDVVMPKMSGPQVVEAVRARYPAIKVLFLSGYHEEAVMLRGVTETTYGFLQKPFTLEELASKVRAVLDGTEAPA